MSAERELTFDDVLRYVGMNEMLSGLSGELPDLVQVLEEAEERTGLMQARAAAFDPLIETVPPFVTWIF